MRDEIPGMLFYISQENDSAIMIYQAKRMQDQLVDEKVIVYKTTLENPTVKSSIPSIILNRLFGITWKNDPKMYIFNLVSLPNRDVRLRLKKQAGRVTATVTLHAQWGKHVIDVENVEVYNVHLHNEKRAKPEKLTVSARVSKPDLRAALQRAKLPVPATDTDDEMVHITEVFVVTSEMMDGVDTESLNDEWTKKQD
jgi:hypothetical protein